MIEGKKLYATEIKKIGALAEVGWFFLATAIRVGGCNSINVDLMKTAARQVRDQLEKYLEHPDICE